MTAPALCGFAAGANELRRQEFARLADAVTPKLEQLRSMTAAALRDEIARMWDRLGHDVITSPDAPELVTVKRDRKFITACANPTDPAPTGTAALRRLRDRVVAACAERGFYVTTRSFTADAQHFRNRPRSTDRRRGIHPRAPAQPQKHALAADLQGHVPAVRRHRAAPARQRRSPALRQRAFRGATSSSNRASRGQANQ